MRVDWGKDNLSFKHKGNDITLQVQEEMAKVKLYES
jgi:hypothetical protein